MSAGDLQPLTFDQVRHVAALARLRPGDAELERYRVELSSILGYMAMLQEPDVAGVEPMAHPLDLCGRMDADEPAKPLPRGVLEAMAPMMAGPFIAVPKVLDDAAGERGGA